MPKCEECKNSVKPDRLFQDLDTGKLCCEECADGKRIVSIPEEDPDTFLGRTYDYDFSYTREKGIRASGRLGGAKVTLEVSQEELTSWLGAPRD